jgi:uncharacterized membrane protein
MTTIPQDFTSYDRGDGQFREPGPREASERVARGLGWFSIGLGLAEIAAPQRMARAIGVPDNSRNCATLRAIGVREIASGVGILSRDRPVGPVWTRVGGDVMDLTLLGRALSSNRSQRTRVAAATAAVLGVTALDTLTGRKLSRSTTAGSARGRAIEVRRAVTIDRPREEVYAFWRNFENLPRFMEHLVSVRVLDDRRSHWKARVPGGDSVEWDAEIIENRPNELIAWRSLDRADIPNTGTVRFLPSPHGGTEVRVELRYEVPGGRLAGTVAKLLGKVPEIQVASDLRRLKQVLELGEIVYSDDSIAPGPNPARPPARRIEVQTPKQGAMR